MCKAKNERKAISKRIRFEIFKRDSFKCQYCGACAPEVLLQIDHIEPVSKGGNNDASNLITACVACNAGKTNKTLDDNSVLSKQRVQMEELQERHEQIEMMMRWKKGLKNLKEDALDRLCSYWEELAPGFVVTLNGKRDIAKWLRKFSLEELIHGMDIASEQYLKFEEDGAVTDESWDKAFSKIPGICRVNRESQDDPEIKELYYIMGITRNVCRYHFDKGKALDLLKIAHSREVPLSKLRDIALQATSWTKFENGIRKAIEHQETGT
jgi:hypothetical protein